MNKEMARVLRSREDRPALEFAPDAWAKLLYFCHRGESEIGGFGVSGPGESLRVREFLTVCQRAGPASVAFSDEAIGDYFDAQADAGRHPQQFGRIWLHTHPGSSAQPSATDEETFGRAFGSCDWAVMFILARGGETYARMRFSAGPGGELLLPVRVDYAGEFAGSDPEAWEAEYLHNIQILPERPLAGIRPEVPYVDADEAFAAGQPAGESERHAMSGLSGSFADESYCAQCGFDWVDHVAGGCPDPDYRLEVAAGYGEEDRPCL